MEKVIVKLENVKKSFGKKKIVEDFNLEVYEKEFLTLLGPSGCGKTTILRMISGLEEVTAGKIYLDGVDVTNIEASRREVNTIFQNYALFSHMTIEDNIAFGLKMKKVPLEKRKKEVEKMLDLVKLKGYNHRKPSELSGGEQQRVAIARGLVNRPKVLLLDEPLSSLDLKLKKEMQVELKRLQKKLGITFIYVTHNQEEALTMSDRILILNKNRVEQLGTPLDIYNNPQTKFVADFIGESNIFKVIVNKVDDKYAYVLLEGNEEVKIINKDYQKGDKIYIMVRPENIKVRSNSKENNLEVKVKENIYNGTMTRLIASYNNQELKINVEADLNYLEDKIINISFKPEDISSFRS